MSSPAQPNEVVVCRFDDLADRGTHKFLYPSPDGDRQGFVMRVGQRVVAYRNECCHIPMTMDWVENRFLSRDGRFIQCATHGALYEPETGLCVDGPPAGETLRGFQVDLRDGEVVVRLVRGGPSTPQLDLPLA